MKKAILSLSLLVTIISATTITKYAASNTNETNLATTSTPKIQNMGNSRVYPSEGGMWEYGTNWTHVWSHYFHQTEHHYSSTIGLHGRKSHDIEAGKRTTCEDFKNPFGKNEAFYVIGKP